jgi:putative transposase
MQPVHYHIIFRGIERRQIFSDDADRDHFVERLGRVLPETSTKCFAWVLIPKHFHLLVQTGHVPISTVMRRLLTSYVVHFSY